MYQFTFLLSGDEMYELFWQMMCRLQQQRSNCRLPIPLKSKKKVFQKKKRKMFRMIIIILQWFMSFLPITVCWYFLFLFPLFERAGDSIPITAIWQNRPFFADIFSLKGVFLCNQTCIYYEISGSSNSHSTEFKTESSDAEWYETELSHWIVFLLIMSFAF